MPVNNCCCGPPVPVYWQARLCLDDTLADVWMLSTDAATLTGAFTILYLSGGLYFTGTDTSATPGTVYSLSEATAYADCASISCGSGSCDPCYKPVDLSGVFNVGGCGNTLSATAPSAQPTAFSGADPCSSDFTTNVYLDAGGGQTWQTNNRFDTVTIVSPDGKRSCVYNRLRIGNATGPGVQFIDYLGPPANGAGSRAGRFYWWKDDTSTTFDPDTGYASDGCTRGNVPPFFDEPPCP